MTVLYLEALAGIAVSLSILMAMAWIVQQRSGNSGWVDTIWTFAAGLVGAGSALWPVAGIAPNPRQWQVAALVAIWSLRLGLHIAVRTARIADDPRYATLAKEWGVDSPRRMFIFLQNQGFTAACSATPPTANGASAIIGCGRGSAARHCRAKARSSPSHQISSSEGLLSI